MTIEELKQKTKHELAQELVADLEANKESELLDLIKRYLEINYHVVKGDVNAKDHFNKDRVLETVLDTVCSEYGVEPQTISSKSRKHPVPDARHTFFYVSRFVTENSIAFGYMADYVKRDHSTAIHGCNKLRGYMNTDKALRNRIDNIIKVVKYKLESV